MSTVIQVGCVREGRQRERLLSWEVKMFVDAQIV